MQQNQELRDLKKQQKSDEESIATLKRELAEKKRTSASLHERVSAHERVCEFVRFTIL